MKSIFAKTLKEWQSHDVRYLSAAVTYFALLSLPALILTILHLAKVFLVKSGNTDALLMRIKEIFPADSADFIGQFGEQSLEMTGFWSGLAAFVLLLWSGSKLVDALDRAINNVFEVEMKPNTKGKWKILLLRKLMSLALLLMFGFMVIAVFLINTLAGNWFEARWVLTLIQNVGSISLMLFIFSLLLKWLAYVELKWKEVFLGGLGLSFLAYLGTLLLDYIFGMFSFASDFSIGASIIIFLLWINYMAMLLFFGVEFLRQIILSKRKIKPMNFAYFKSKPQLFLELNGFSKFLGGVSTIFTQIKIARWYLNRKKKRAKKKLAQEQL